MVRFTTGLCLGCVPPQMVKETLTCGLRGPVLDKS